MPKQKLLRICHKFMKDNDGYDLDVQDMVKSLSGNYDTYVMFFITKEELPYYIEKNKLSKKHAKDGEYLFHKQSKAKLIPIFYTKRYDNYLKDLYLLENIRSFKPQLKKHLDGINPDIVHIHGTLTVQFLLSAVMAKEMNAKVFATHHICMINKHYHRQKARILIMKYIIHNIFPLYCDRVICVSREGTKSFMTKKNISVINPVPLEIEPAKVPEQKGIKHILTENLLKNKFSLSLRDKVYICPARFHEQKNQYRLVKAFDLALKDNSRLKLILAGNISNKTYFNRIKQLINRSKHKDNFCILMQLNQHETHQLLKRADFLLAPSINEGFGRIAMEAIQHKVPVIASNTGGFSDFIHSDKGILVNPHSIRSIEKAITDITKVKINKHSWNHSDYIKRIRNLYLTV